jgi:hypothetical protein
MSDELATIPGALPLRNPRHEAFCRARSLLAPKIEAYRHAELGGHDVHADRGNASKLERKPTIRDRIAYLCRQDVEILTQKRKRLEEFLWLVHDTKHSDLWEVSERPKLDGDGDPVLDDEGNPKMVRYERAKFLSELPDDLQRAVEAVEINKFGDMVPKTYSKMQANAELRKLLGIGVNADDRNGSEFERLSDQQLLSELSRRANELGVPVTLGFGVNERPPSPPQS